MIYWDRIAEHVQAKFEGDPNTNKISVLAPHDGSLIFPVMEHLQKRLPEYHVTLRGADESLFYNIYRRTRLA